MASKKRTNESEAGSASLPPLKRQKIVAASSSSSSSSVSNEELAAENLQLKQRLQSAEEENARLHEELTVVQPLQEENQRLHALNGSMKESMQT